MEKHSNTMIDPKNHSGYITIVYDDSIGITIEDASSTCTFLIDTFSDYITIFHSLPHPFY